MQELGVDLSAAQPQLLTAELAGDANVLVTMGCGEACPCVPGLTMVQWQIPDPHNQVSCMHAYDEACRMMKANGWSRRVVHLCCSKR
jgi:protein-tyrosine-phosphatase